MRDWRDKGKTNHILINAVTEYPKSHLSTYFDLYRKEYKRRYHKDINSSIVKEFSDFPLVFLIMNSYCGITANIFWRANIICMKNMNLVEEGLGFHKKTGIKWIR